MRQSSLSRHTTETKIDLTFTLDGSGIVDIHTDVAFFNHMLTLFTYHGLFDLQLNAIGDIDIDYHHTVEDIGICLGIACRNAIGAAEGITRYASGLYPMDEALIQIALDVSNRPHLSFNCNLPKSKIGTFDSELVEEFFHAFVNNSRISLHIDLIRGKNLHHIIEACFKGFGQCLDKATQFDSRKKTPPSTKGLL